MRFRSALFAAAVTSGALLAPFASPAGAVTTTSTYVAYLLETDTGSQLVTRPADGSGSPLALTGATDMVWDPAVSPDGTAVRGGAGRSAMSPAYSRDGSQLFWTEYDETCESEDPGNSDIWAGNPDGTGAEALAVTAADEILVSVGGGSAPTADTTAPAAPVVDAAGSVGTTSARITWAAVADATEYVVLRKPHGTAAPTSLTDGTLVYDGGGRSATASGLTAGTAYDLYVLALDPSGNASAPSAAHPVRPTAPPVLSAMGNVGLISTTNTYPVRWTGAVAPYRVDVGSKTRSSTGVWSTKPVYKTHVASTTAKTVNHTGAQGTTYFFQVKGTDGFGNVTGYSGAKSASVPLNENYYAASYSTGWTSASPAAGRWLNSVRYTTTAGRTMSGKFETSSFQLVGDRCATCGKLEVWVDGVKKATIDTYSSSTKTRQPLYTSGFYGSVKPHTIKVVALGTAGRPRVGIDAIGLAR